MRGHRQIVRRLHHEAPASAPAFPQRPQKDVGSARRGLQAHDGAIVLQQRRRRRRGVEPGRGRHQRRLRIGRLTQTRRDAVAVLGQRDQAEVDVPARGRPRAQQLDLARDLLRAEGLALAADGAGEQARPDVPRVRVLRQPVVEQHREGLRRAVDGPVQLRCQVVEPAFGEPALDIGIQLVVLAEALDAGWPQRRFAEPERADAETRARPDRTHQRVHRLHQPVDVRAAPVVARQRAGVAAPGCLVGERHLVIARAQRVGVEVVVDVHAVDVVAAQHVGDDGQRVRGGAGLGRVEPELVAVAPHQRRLRHRHVRRHVGRLRRGMARAVGVEPGVQLEPAPVRLGDPERQRVPRRLRRQALRPAEELGPRLQCRRVDRVAARPHLQHDGVEPDAVRMVEQRQRLGSLLRHRQPGQARPVDVVHGGDPGGAELARHRRRHFAVEPRDVRRGRRRFGHHRLDAGAAGGQRGPRRHGPQQTSAAHQRGSSARAAAPGSGSGVVSSTSSRAAVSASGSPS